MADNDLPDGFGQVDPDFMTKAYANAKKERSDTNGVIFIKSGITQVRVLPPHKDAPSWAHEYKEHGLHPNGKFETFVCPGKGECVICALGTELYDEKTEESIEAAKRLRAKNSYLYNVYVYSSPDGQSLKDGMFILKSGTMVYKQLMDYDGDAAGGWGDITSLTNGLELRIDRQGKGRFETKYVVKPIPTRSNLIEKLAAEGFEIGKPADLTQIFVPKSDEEMKLALKTDAPTED